MAGRQSRRRMQKRFELLKIASSYLYRSVWGHRRVTDSMTCCSMLPQQWLDWTQPQDPTKDHATPTAYTLPGPRSRAYFSFFFLEVLSVPPGLVCLLFFLCLASSNRDGGAGRPGVWEVRLCAPGRGHDGAVYGKSEAEVRPEIQLERRKGGEEEGGSSWMVEMQRVILHVYRMVCEGKQLGLTLFSQLWRDKKIKDKLRWILTGFNMCKLKKNKRYKFHTTILILTVWRVEFISLWLREDVTIKHKRGKKDHDSLLPPRSRSASV